MFVVIVTEILLPPAVSLVVVVFGKSNASDVSVAFVAAAAAAAAVAASILPNGFVAANAFVDVGVVAVAD